MYKKITHTIVEEHFDHPMAAHIKATNDGCIITPPPPALPSFSLDKIYKFRSSTRALLAKYFWRTRSLIVCLLEDGADAAALQERLGSDIVAISRVLVPYYGEEAAAAFTAVLKAYTTAVLDQVGAIKLDTNSPELAAVTSASIEALAKLLDGANPTNWPAAAVSTMFNKLTDAWLAQATSRKQNDWISDFLAVDDAQGTFITDANSFSDIFVNGIIAQFADKF